MAECRRLLIQPARLENCLKNTNVIPLTIQEDHYISRVLRLRKGDKINLIDGFGNLWLAEYYKNNILKVNSSFLEPDLIKSKPTPLICLAIALPKKGIEDVVRFCTEIGIDVIQPIFSERSVVDKINTARLTRLELICNEAIEQSERLWKPEIRKPIEFSKWLDVSDAKRLFNIAVTRIPRAIPLGSALTNYSNDVKEIWVFVGPEGGWTEHEINFAIDKNFIEIVLGETILRTSTAAIVATQLMQSWRYSSI